MRPRLRRAELPAGESLLLLDEIHKYAGWRNLLKGIWDTERSRRRILVTGSARLDYYRKGGDSLAGRYRYFRTPDLIKSAEYSSLNVSSSLLISSTLACGHQSSGNHPNTPAVLRIRCYDLEKRNAGAGDGNRTHVFSLGS